MQIRVYSQHSLGFVDRQEIGVLSVTVERKKTTPLRQTKIEFLYIKMIHRVDHTCTHFVSRCAGDLKRE